MRYFFHTTFMESNSDTFVVDTDGYLPKTTSFHKFILAEGFPFIKQELNMPDITIPAS